jgi:hypothetical protein
MNEQLPFVPPGTEAIARWAMGQRYGFDPRPDQRWFRQWEPFDTMVVPTAYYNAVSWSARRLSITVAEPWTEEGDSEPVDRALLAFGSHPDLAHRAAMRVGEHFLTRVTYLLAPPPPRVELGDRAWDERVVCHALSASEASAAFTPALRALVAEQTFAGHIEIRPGGAIVYLADRKPVAAHYQELLTAAQKIIMSALNR